MRSHPASLAHAAGLQTLPTLPGRLPPSYDKGTVTEAAFPCHQSLGPCTETWSHPHSSQASSFHQMMQLEEQQGLWTAWETWTGRPGPHRTPSLCHTPFLGKEQRESPVGLLVFMFADKHPFPMSTWPQGCEDVSTLALNFSHGWKGNGC